MMTPTERATLAVAEHYSRRSAEIAGALLDRWAAPDAPALRAALRIVARARSAELRNPEEATR